jgi:PBP1b-binding outer membrane lipoprotein LpoB
MARIKFAMKRFFSIAAILLVLAGCAKAPDEAAGLARTPEQAASQMEQAFGNTQGRTRDLALAASEALRKGEYETAVVSLQTVREDPAITTEQRMAVYSSAVSLEARLIGAMESGDKNAERAYQLLKAMKRD